MISYMFVGLLAPFAFMSSMCFLQHHSRREKPVFSHECTHRRFFFFFYYVVVVMAKCLLLYVTFDPSAPPPLCQISKKDSGMYEVVLKDDRGKDTATLNLKDQGNSEFFNCQIQFYCLFPVCI